MRRRNAQKGEKGYVYGFLHNGINKYACNECAVRNNIEEFTPKKEVLEGEGITVSVEDYTLLKFARRNCICKVLYKVLGGRKL